MTKQKPCPLDCGNNLQVCDDTDPPEAVYVCRGCCVYYVWEGAGLVVFIDTRKRTPNETLDRS